jgi:hypothetical protein
MIPLDLLQRALQGSIQVPWHLENGHTTLFRNYFNSLCALLYCSYMVWKVLCAHFPNVMILGWRPVSFQTAPIYKTSPTQRARKMTAKGNYICEFHQIFHKKTLKYNFNPLCALLCWAHAWYRLTYYGGHYRAPSKFHDIWKMGKQHSSEIYFNSLCALLYCS